MSAKLSHCLPSRCGGAVFHDLPVPGCALARKLRLQSYECKATAAARLQWHGCSATVLRLQSYDCSAMIPSCRRCLWCCIPYWCYDPALSADTSFILCCLAALLQRVPEVMRELRLVQWVAKLRWRCCGCKYQCCEAMVAVLRSRSASFA